MYFYRILILVLINLNQNASTEPAEPRNQRVMGGKAANPKDWPFMAAVVYGRYVASLGTLIRPNWILTAAVYVDGNWFVNYRKWFGKMNVRLGTGDMTYVKAKDVALPGYANIEELVLVIGVKDKLTEIEKIIVHKRFGVLDVDKHGKGPGKIGYNNSALIKLSTTDSTAKPVNFASIFFHECNITNTVCRAAGWGHNATAGQVVKLQETGKLVLCAFVEPGKCECNNDTMKMLIRSFQNVPYEIPLIVYGQDKLLAITEHPKSVHMSDIGGPLICEDLKTTEKKLQAIIIAHNFDDEVKKQLNIFGDVSLFQDIQDQLDDKPTTEPKTEPTSEPTTDQIFGDDEEDDADDQDYGSRSSICRKNDLIFTFLFILIVLNFY